MMDIIRIRMKQNVRPDLLFGKIHGKPGTILRAGMEYPAISNKHGAISGICDNGEKLGVKPGEFNFVEAPKWVLDIWEDEELSRTVISDGAGVTGIKIILKDRIINNGKLLWHETKDADIEEKHLTLKEIYWQLKAKGYNGIIYVWEEDAIEGTIYVCGNHGEGLWEEHGTTRGYA